MFKTLFKWKRKHQWIVMVKNGDIIRLCDRTGETEYRDFTNKSWVPMDEIGDINPSQPSASHS